MNIYDLKLTHLRYRVSDDARQNEYTPYILRKTAIDYDQIDLRVAAFMRNYIEGVNFFVINKEGEYIYKNNAFGKIVRNINAQTLDPKSWAVSKKVMEQGIQKTVEEEFQGTTYLSIKAPLVIDYMVEGVIGLAVDITDRKKKEELENKLKIGEELYRIAKTVTHDLAQPVTVLRGYLDINKSLSHKERRVYNKAIENIESIAERLFSKYRGTNKVVKNQYILLWLCLKEVIEEQRKIDSDIEIKYLFNSSEKFVFIKGNMVDFSRMISNIIKNSIEAVEGKKREIKVSYEVKGEEVEIRVKDNGKGMSKKMSEKIKKGEEVGTTKKEGHGIGMQQIMDTVKEMKGKLKIKSKEGVGTEIRLKFEKGETPSTFMDTIKLYSEGTVVVLDKDKKSMDAWKERLKEYEKEIWVKYFNEVKGAIEFIKKKRGKVFLITEYDLRDNYLNGIELIKRYKLEKRAVLVTETRAVMIKDFDFNGKIKLIPKAIMNDVNLEISKSNMHKKR
jgi:signal transduction histidine kinase